MTRDFAFKNPYVVYTDPVTGIIEHPPENAGYDKLAKSSTTLEDKMKTSGKIGGSEVEGGISTGFADGTVGAPGAHWTGASENTGWYLIGADNVGLSLNGAKKINYAATKTTFEADVHIESRIQIEGDAATQNIFNANKVTQDTIIKSQSFDYLFIANGTSNRIGIGKVSSPDRLLHINADGGTAPTTSASTVEIVQNNLTTGVSSGLSIIGGTAANSILNFGDSGDENAGYIIYSNTNDEFIIGAGASDAYSVSGSAMVVNNLSRDFDFIVNGDSVSGVIHTNAGTDRVGFFTGVPTHDVHMATNSIRLDCTLPPIGAGAAATLGKVGGTGPTAQAQATWVKINIQGTDHFLAAWI